MSIKTFNASSIDPVALKKRAAEECDAIWKSSYDNKQGRTKDDLMIDCLKGHAAELHLLSCGFKDNPKKYMDVFDFEGDTVDVKVIMNVNSTYTSTSIKNTLERARKKKLSSLTSSTYEFANKVYIYLIETDIAEYNLQGIYCWNGKEFIKS
jgi:hypothetical protein